MCRAFYVGANEIDRIETICLPRQVNKKEAPMHYKQEETAGYLIYRVGRLLRYHAGQFFREQGESITP